jgi:hypothetical protein
MRAVGRYRGYGAGRTVRHRTPRRLATAPDRCARRCPKGTGGFESAFLQRRVCKPSAPELMQRPLPSTDETAGRSAARPPQYGTKTVCSWLSAGGSRDSKSRSRGRRSRRPGPLYPPNRWVLPVRGSSGVGVAVISTDRSHRLARRQLLLPNLGAALNWIGKIASGPFPTAL